MGVAQTLAWPILHMYVLTKSTAAKARPVSAAGAFVDCLDVLQVLSLQSQLWGCNSAICAAVRRDFSSSFIVVQSLGLSCGFSSTSVCGPHTGIYSQGCPGAQEPSPVGMGHMAESEAVGARELALEGTGCVGERASGRRCERVSPGRSPS